MQLTPARLVGTGILAVFALGASFVAGISIGEGAEPSPSVDPGLRAALPAETVMVPDPPRDATAVNVRIDRVIVYGEPGPTPRARSIHPKRMDESAKP